MGEGVAVHEVDDIGDSGGGEGGAGEFDFGGIDLKGGDAASGGAGGEGEPQGRVSGAGADLNAWARREPRRRAER